MTLNATKFSLSLTHGIGPYCPRLLLTDLKNAWYSLIVDETSIEQDIKQFDIHVRFWNEGHIITCYLTSAFLGCARADDLHKSIIDLLAKDDIALSKMFH